MASKGETWTTVVVGRDGEVFDLSKNEYPPRTRNGKNYIPMFGTTMPQALATKLKKMTHKEVLQFYGRSKETP